MADEAAAGGGKKDLTLLGFWTSPFAYRARCALNLKGLPYEYLEEDILGDKSQLLLGSNPVHKKIPVLIHAGKPVAESQIIVQYIDEAFPAHAPRLLPSDPHGRAVARFWAAYVDDKLLSTWVPIYNGRTREERAEAGRQLVGVLEAFEGAFKESSKGKDFFGGDSVGLVDVVLGGWLAWLRASEPMCGVKVIDAATTPLLAAWADRFAALDGVAEILPDVQSLLEYNMMKRARNGLPYLPPLQQNQ